MRTLTDGERDILREQQEDAWPTVGDWPAPADVDICPHHDVDVDGHYHPVYRGGLCEACHNHETAEYEANREADEAFLQYQSDRALTDAPVSYDASEMPW